MIDFANGTIVKLSPSQAGEDVMNMLVQGEEVYRSFKGARDSVHFTSKRIIAVNVQGLTGKKMDYSSLPYSKIQAWSVETAGRFDRDCELEMWFSGLGKVRLEFAGSVEHQGPWTDHRRPRPLSRLGGNRAQPPSEVLRSVGHGGRVGGDVLLVRVDEARPTRSGRTRTGRRPRRTPRGSRG